MLYGRSKCDSQYTRVLYIMPIGNGIPEFVLLTLQKELQLYIPVNYVGQINIGETLKIPDNSYNTYRGQYKAHVFMDILRNRHKNNRILGITAVDLYTEPLNFIFGQAEIGGRIAIISLYRLVYGATKNLFLQRTIKESVHELGHTFGLEHCSNTTCVMHFSNSLADTDRKGKAYCPICMKHLLG